MRYKVWQSKSSMLEEFMLECVTRAKGSSVSWAELYVRYRRWCADKGLNPCQRTCLANVLIACALKASCELAPRARMFFVSM